MPALKPSRKPHKSHQKEDTSKTGTPLGERSQNFTWSCLFSWPHSKLSSYSRVSSQTSDMYQTLSKKMLDASSCTKVELCKCLWYLLSAFYINIWKWNFGLWLSFKERQEKQKILGAFPTWALKGHLIWPWSYDSPIFLGEDIEISEAKSLFISGHTNSNSMIPPFFRWGRWVSGAKSLYKWRTNSILWLKNLSA